MENFIGRQGELETLEREYRRDSGFVVVYGRRRVGKTTLIKEFIKGKQALYFLATQEVEKENMRRLTGAIAELTNQEFLRAATFADWEQLIAALVSYRPEQKKVLVIDEFQYLVKVNPAFPSIFQRIWDEVLHGKNIMVILCGSLVTMMTTHVLSYESPLYGRRTAQIRLRPLGFVELHQHFSDRSFTDMVESYAVTGGVPKYLALFDNNVPLWENIRAQILQKDSFLYEEPIFLMEKEVQDIVSYFSIMRQIARGNHRISHLSTELGIKSSSLTPYLRTLLDLELIERRVPVTEQYPEKSRKGLYFIKDNFIDFWFKSVQAYKGELELGKLDYVVNRLQERFIESHVSYVFEQVSREIFAELCAQGSIDMPLAKIGSYWGPRVEVDLLALDEAGKRAVIGECKYRREPVDIKVLTSLIAKSAEIPDIKGYSLSYALFSRSGFDKKVFSAAEVRGDILLIDQGRLNGRQAP